MKVSARGLNRATLHRQMLLQREALDVDSALRRLVALQAQQAASPYLALWNRIVDFDPTSLDIAFANRSVVKATLMRVTLHAVRAEDYRPFREAMEPTLRAARLNDNRFKMSGLTVDDVHQLIPHLLEHAGSPRTTPEVESWLEGRFGVPRPGAWWALRQYAPLLHAPTGLPWSFGARPSYVAAGSRPAFADPRASSAGMRELVKRYLSGFGPASVADMAQFAMVQRPVVREAVKSLSDELELLEGPDGGQLYDVAGAPRPDSDVPAPPRLMAMWDSVLLAHADRSRLLPAEYRKDVIRTNGDVLPTLLIDGRVAGVWRPLHGGIEATTFQRLSEDEWEGLAVEARALLALLANREPLVYSRYGHWWSKLQGLETRVLPPAP